MRNFTTSRSKLFRLNFIAFLLLISYNASAQFYTKHYIAPAPWQYFSKANEIVIATNSIATVDITLKKSDGTLEANLTAKKGEPAIYRFKLLAKNLPMNALNTVINAAGLIVESTAPTSINMRNIASDDYVNGENVDANIKGNAALTSFGDAGIGIRFRVGYYRDGSLGNFASLGDQRPIYSIMAITNSTSVTIDGVVKATLDAGQSYLFKAPIGTLVQSSNPTVMNTSAAIDMPNGCGDGAFNQIPPESVLGSEYFIERGKGNDTAEQTTVVATKDNTTVTVDTYSAAGVLTKTTTTVLATAGKFFTFLNGNSVANFSASRVSADKNVAVYSGTAQSCEVDISTIAPVSECGGSNFIETAKFRNYGTGSLPYFGYVLLKDATAVVNVNGTNIETVSGINPRHQLGSTGWYIINFEDTQIGSPDVLSISSTAKLTVSIVQQGGGFSMAGFFSNFAAQPEEPTMTYISGGGCTNNTATLTTPSGFAPYQWYFNGTAITGANSNSYVASKTGSYSVASTLACGVQTQSKPVSVTLCTDLGVTKTVDNATPCVGANVEFTVKLSNLGVNNASGVSINDLLPSGYTFVSATPSIGTYNSGTGVWSIGDINGGISETLKVIAKVNATGVYTNKASLPDTTIDSDSSNNSASALTTPNPLPTLVVNNPASVCSPATVNLTAPEITSGSSSDLTFTYWTNSTATTSYTKPTAATSGTYYIKATTISGCSVIKPVVVTVAAKPNAGTLSGTANICVAGTTTFTSNGNSGGAWSSSDTTIATVDPSTGLITGVSAGTAIITYTVTGTGGCANASSTRNVIVTTPANAGTLSGTVNICVAGTSTFTSNGNSGGAWSSSDTSIATVNSSTGLVTGKTSGKAIITYTVTGTGGCANASSTRNVTVTTPANAGTLSGTTNICVAGTSTFTSNGNSGGAWSSSDTAIATVDSSTGLVTGKTSGTAIITYTVTGTGGCANASSTRNVTVTTPANAGTLSGTANICVAGTSTFTSNGNSGGVWSSNDTAIATVDSSTGLITGKTSGTATITYTVTGAGGCANASSTRNVVVTTPANAGTLSGTANICVAGTTTFTSNGNSGGAWSSSDTAIAIVDSSTGLVTGISAGTATITYTVTGTGGCPDALAIRTITVNETPTQPLLSAVTQQTCTNSKGSFTITNYNSNYTYLINPSIDVTQTGNSITAPVGNYTIIAKLNDCESSTSSTAVVDSKICANIDSYPSEVTGTTVPTVVGNVTENDKLNGLPVTSANTNVTPIKTGPLSIDADGELTLDANTVSGTYVITYQICEEGAPANCSTNTATVVVGNPIIANIDSYPSEVTGTTAPTVVGNVTENDKLNGLPVTSANTNVTPIKMGPLSIDADGELTLDANTVSGTFVITYQICEEGAPANCSSNTATVVVGNPIIANIDNYPSEVTGTAVPTVVGNVTENDKLNGLPVTSANTNVTPIKTGPLSIDADGELTLDANTVSGTYVITYQICEEGAPANCSSNTATVVVGNPIIANIDSYPSEVTGTTVPTVVGNVTENDKLNGLPVTSANTNVTPIKMGPLSIDADGELTLDANTVSGTYVITYQICEEGAPANCSSNTATVVVGNPIIANIDSYPSEVTGTTVPTVVGNVTENDKLNGLPVTSANTNVTPIKTGPLNIDADGELTLDANTVSGTYVITYQICEEGAPANCSSNTATVVVGNPIIANIDSYPSEVTGTTVPTVAGNVTENDKLNGLPVTSANTNVTPIKTGPLSIDADGELTLDANTVSGTYVITYQICEEGAPANCSSNTATVVVGNPIIANIDNYPSEVTGTTAPTVVGNVTENDKLNGLPVTSANTNVTPIKTGPLSIDADGELTLDANTVSGTYVITYQICEEGAPANCSSNTATVVVGNGTIMAVTENTASINGSIGGTTLSLIDNDTLNGFPAVIKNSSGGVILKSLSFPAGLTLNSDGTVKVDARTPIGNYEVEYSICEYLNPGNCATVKSYIAVTGAVLQANNDNAGTVDSSKGQNSTTNIFSNDKLNGLALNPADVTLKTIVFNSHITLKDNGIIEVKPGTPEGIYELTYQICEVLNQSNCSEAIAKITVINITDPTPPITPLSPLVLNNDVSVNVDGINGSLEFVNVLDNDLLNGLPINPSDVIIANTPKSPYFEFNSDGTVSVKPNTPGGDYSLQYQVCEKANPLNCATATLNVFVEFPAVAIIKTAAFNDENNSGFANAGETITYKFKVTNTGNVPLFGVMVSDPLTGVILSGQAIYLDVNETDENNFTAIYKITQGDINSGSVSNQATVKGTSGRGVVVEDRSDDETNTGDKPTALPLKGCEIKVFNAFSPNGDSKNSRFYIRGLECYPDNTVEIYNRWGVLVYDIDHYNNEDRAFKGFSEGRTTVKQSDGLPVGTYFYILKYKDSESNQHELSGYLYINK